MSQLRLSQGPLLEYSVISIYLQFTAIQTSFFEISKLMTILAPGVWWSFHKNYSGFEYSVHICIQCLVSETSQLNLCSRNEDSLNDGFVNILLRDCLSQRMLHLKLIGPYDSKSASYNSTIENINSKVQVSQISFMQFRNRLFQSSNKCLG